MLVALLAVPSKHKIAEGEVEAPLGVMMMMMKPEACSIVVHRLSIGSRSCRASPSATSTIDKDRVYNWPIHHRHRPIGALASWSSSLGEQFTIVERPPGGA
jgi:hypothetical protein